MTETPEHQQPSSSGYTAPTALSTPDGQFLPTATAKRATDAPSAVGPPPHVQLAFAGIGSAGAI